MVPPASLFIEGSGQCGEGKACSLFGFIPRATPIPGHRRDRGLDAIPRSLHPLLD
jgi:hypothetical protein